MIRVILGLSVVAVLLGGCSSAKPDDSSDVMNQKAAPTVAAPAGKTPGMGAPTGAPTLGGPTGAAPLVAGSRGGK